MFASKASSSSSSCFSTDTTIVSALGPLQQEISTLKPSSPIEKLPADLAILILSYLPISQVFQSILKISKYFYIVATHDACWESLFNYHPEVKQILAEYWVDFNEQCSKHSKPTPALGSRQFYADYIRYYNYWSHVKKLWRVLPGSNQNYNSRTTALFIGSRGVGKRTTITTLLKKWDIQLPLTLIGMQQCDIALETKNQYNDVVNVRLYCISADPLTSRMWDKLYLSATHCIIGFDVTNRQSFDEVDSVHLKKCRAFVPDSTVLLVGIKTDLPRQVSKLEAQEYAQSQGNMAYLEISNRNMDYEELIAYFLADVRTLDPTLIPINMTDYWYCQPI